MDNVFKGCIILILFLLGVLFQISNIDFLKPIWILLFITVLGLILEWGFGMIAKIKNNKGIILVFAILPLVYCFLFNWFYNQYTGTTSEWYSMLNGIYTLYVTITTIFLSVSFLNISLSSKTTGNNEVQHPKIDNASTINFMILAYSIGGIGVSIFSFIISSFQGFGLSDISIVKSNLYIGFIVSSFFVVGTIFGTTLYVLEIMVAKYGNPLSRDNI